MSTTPSDFLRGQVVRKQSRPNGSLIFVEPEKRPPVGGDRVTAKLKSSDSVTFKICENEDGRQWLMSLIPSTRRSSMST